MRYNVLIIWLGVVFLFTVAPFWLAFVYGPHPVFYRVQPNFVLHLLSVCSLLLGACIPVFMRLRIFQVYYIYKLFINFFAIGVSCFIASHIIIGMEFGLDFRHHMRISSLGLLGYFYALEQIIVVPLTFFVLRLMVFGVLDEMRVTKGVLIVYAFVLGFLPFNISNLICAVVIGLAVLFPNVINTRFNFYAALLYLLSGLLLLMGATVVMKGAGLDGMENMVRYLQYRISIWAVSADLLSNIGWDARLLMLEESLSDEARLTL